MVNAVQTRRVQAADKHTNNTTIESTVRFRLKGGSARVQEALIKSELKLLTIVVMVVSINIWVHHLVRGIISQM